MNPIDTHNMIFPDKAFQCIVKKQERTWEAIFGNIVGVVLSMYQGR